MDGSSYAYLWALFCVFLLLLEGFFSGSEMALISVDPLEARKDEKIYFFVRHPEKLLATTLLGTNLCVVANSTLLTHFFSKKFGLSGELLTVAVLSPLVLVFGETIPKTIARNRPYSFARFFIKPFLFAYRLFLPFSSFVLKIMGFAGTEGLTRDIKVSRESLTEIIERDLYSGIEPTERELIQRIMALKSKRVREVMKSIVQVTAVEVNDPVRKVLELAGRLKYTRFPVYQEHIYNIVGVLNIYSLLNARLDEPIKPYVKDAYFVPEFKNVWSTFLEMQARRQPFSIVVDEFGAALGIVTVEDALEAIVGEIEDEYDLSLERSRIERISENTFDVKGSLEIDTLRQELGIDLPKEDVYETMAGFLLYILERIPEKGERIPYGDLCFEILDADRKTVRKVRIYKDAQSC